MLTKTTGFALIILGIILIIYSGFNFITTKKIVDLGSVEINKKENHYIQWSPLLGIIIIAGGILVVVQHKKSN